MNRFLISIALLLVACGDDGTPADTGSPDSATTDSATMDGATMDSATMDSATMDSGTRDGGSPVGGAIRFVQNAPAEHEYGLETVLPSTFGVGELTLEVWVRLDSSFPVGPTRGSSEQLTNWADADNRPYSDGNWWFDGNFLLDGHNNASGFAQGTFSLQFYGGGRVRWLFGDGATAGPGGHWSVGVFPATDTDHLLDDTWHRIATVRRFSGASGATLELWIDGVMIAIETSTERTNMRDYWDGWSGFPTDQEGWFWGTEKQAAVGVLTQYEDYKGEMAELRFWDVARTPESLADWDRAIRGDEAGLIGRIPFSEGSGTTACDVIEPSRCMRFTRWDDALWLPAGPPLRAP